MGVQTSVAVLFAELFKLIFCLLVLLCFVTQGPCALVERLRVDIWARKWDTLKVTGRAVSPVRTHAVCTHRRRKPSALRPRLSAV